MALTIIENACVFDGFHDELSEGQNLVIENDIIREISSEPVKSQSGTRIDVKGGTVMPGLIDAHVRLRIFLSRSYTRRVSAPQLPFLLVKDHS